MSATLGDFLTAARRHLDLAQGHHPDRLVLSPPQAAHTLRSLTSLVSTLCSYSATFGWLEPGSRKSLTPWQTATRDLDQRLRAARGWLMQACDQVVPVDSGADPAPPIAVAIIEAARALGIGKDLLASHWTDGPHGRVALTDLADVINSPPARRRLLDEVAGHAAAAARLGYTLATVAGYRTPGSRTVLPGRARSALSNAALTLDHPWTSLAMAQSASRRSLTAVTAVGPALPPSVAGSSPAGDDPAQLLAVVVEAGEHLRQAAYRDGRATSIEQTSAGLRTTATAMAIGHHLAQGILRQVALCAAAMTRPTQHDVFGELLAEAARRSAAATSAWITVRESWRWLHTLPPNAPTDPVRAHAERLVVHLGRVLHADRHWQPGHGSTRVPRRDGSEIVSGPASLTELLDTLRSVSGAAAALGVEHRATLTALCGTGRLFTSDLNAIDTVATRLPTAPATGGQLDALTHAYERARLTSANCEATLAATVALAAPPTIAGPLAARLALEAHRSGIGRSLLSPAASMPFTAPPDAGASL